MIIWQWRIQPQWAQTHRHRVNDSRRKRNARSRSSARALSLTRRTTRRVVQPLQPRPPPACLHPLVARLFLHRPLSPQRVPDFLRALFSIRCLIYFFNLSHFHVHYARFLTLEEWQIFSPIDKKKKEFVL